MLAREPLDAAALARLSPAAQKAVAPGPGRMLAARGLVPLPKPIELVTVLYQVAVSDPALTAAAVATADGVPESVLGAALADPSADARVLDWLVARAVRTPALFDALALNPAAADETIADLAARADARGVDLIAGNEVRLLRHPPIVAALFNNVQARMSTVDRAVETAVRAGLRVEGIAAWDELAKLMSAGTSGAREAGGISEADGVFARALAAVGDVADSAVVAESTEEGVAIPEDQDKLPVGGQDKVPIGALSLPAKIRLASLGNAFARSILIRDPIKLVAVAVIKSPGVTDLEAAKYAGSHSLADDVIRYICTRRDWTRLYGIKKSLVMNPKTPISESSKLLIHLRANDLHLVSKSRGVPSAVVAQARKLITQRSGGGR
ncbi:MAG TPA: hypothetical protein VHE35_09500 [Kofleriaceae bacterium]|nr:hypothetical protein [Kofleriaceae bacterium]